MKKSQAKWGIRSSQSNEELNVKVLKKQLAKKLRLNQESNSFDFLYAEIVSFF